MLGRRALATALADKLYDHAAGPVEVDPGPTVVTVEGPWGCGKSTFMDFVRDRLPDPPTTPASPRRLTVRQASRLLRNGAPPRSEPLRPAPRRGVISAWFNPWAHQSGEQVWAGLVAEIIDAAEPVLYPTENAREWYWFTRNLSRVDRWSLRRTLHRRTLSPELTLGALGVLASMAIAIAELETTISVVGMRMPTALVALMLSAGFLLLGGAHTTWRFLRGSAVRYLPGELFHGPVSSTVAPDADRGEATPPEGLVDPLRRARAGSLYLHQHDVSGLLADLDRAGCELIVFVDDLDRCRAQTTAEVFEAINLFLAGFVAVRRGTRAPDVGDPGGSLRARFVIGLDPVVVAGHLDRVYADLYEPNAGLDDTDPGPGWAFLRKLVHLPVVLPQVSDEDMFRFVDLVTNADDGAPGIPDEPAVVPATEAHPPRLGGHPPRIGRPGTDPLPRTGGRSWLAVQHPRVRDLIRERITEQPDRSIREATRQLNLWQFYDRVLATTDPLADEEAQATRTGHLVVLAEIVSRWPSLQRFLHRDIHGRTYLCRFAAAAGDDRAWRDLIEAAPAELSTQQPALSGLRDLLRRYDGPAVAALAARLL
jgi:hypothetical protein